MAEDDTGCGAGLQPWFGFRTGRQRFLQNQPGLSKDYRGRGDETLGEGLGLKERELLVGILFDVGAGFFSFFHRFWCANHRFEIGFGDDWDAE